MNYPNILLQVNLLFIKIVNSNGIIENTEPKYIAGSIYGKVFTNVIYTFSEIKKRYPDAIEVNSFLEIKDKLI